MTSKYWGPAPSRLTVSFTQTTATYLKNRIVAHMNAWSKSGDISFALTNEIGDVHISRGGGGFILISDDVDPFDANAVRATMGAVFKQRIVRAGFDEFLYWTKKHRRPVVGASPAGTIFYNRARYRPPTVLLLGSKRSGLTDHETSLFDQLVHIPWTPDTDSLNASAGRQFSLLGSIPLLAFSWNINKRLSKKDEWK